MDGTLVATELLYHRAWQHTAKTLGYTLADDVMHQTVGKRIMDCYALIQQALGADFPLARFQSAWWPIWQELAATEGIVQKPGLSPLLTLLDTHAIPKAVATSSERAEAIYTLEKANLLAHFSTVVTGDQVTRGKPAPDIFLLTAEQLGVDPAQCIAIEDSAAGVQAATAAGMRTFMIPDLLPPQPATAALAYQVVDSLADVQAWISAEWLSGSQ